MFIASAPDDFLVSIYLFIYLFVNQVNLTRLAEEIYVIDPNEDEEESFTYDTPSLVNGITYNISMSAINHLGFPGRKEMTPRKLVCTNKVFEKL